MVRVDWRDRVVVVTIDRPERRNAVDHPTLLALLGAQHEATTRGARVLVLTGAPPAFCAGADLNGVENDEFINALVRTLRGFTSLGLVTVAAIDGPALGAGTQLAVACDLRIATPTSMFGVPAAKLGLAVDRWTVDRVAQVFGGSVARGMLLAAQNYTAEQLHVAGGVHRMGGLAEALVWADELASLAPLTMQAHKLALESSVASAAVDEHVERARLAAWQSADAEEGRRAFLDKRSPRFLGE